MKVYYIDNGQNPNVLAAVYDRDDFAWVNSIQIPHQVFIIDEIAPVNKNACRSIANHIGRVDAQGQARYYINASGQLMEVEGWQEAVNG